MKKSVSRPHGLEQSPGSDVEFFNVPGGAHCHQPANRFANSEVPELSRGNLIHIDI